MCIRDSAFAAAQEALAMSAMEIDPFRTGIVMGTAMDGVAEIAETQACLLYTSRCV